MLTIDVRRRGDMVVLDLAGKLHQGDPAERLTDKVNSLLHQGNRRFVINLEMVRTMDSPGFGALIEAQSEVEGAGGQIALVNVTKRLRDMIVIAGLLSHFRIFEAEAEAAAALMPEWTDAPSAPAGYRLFGTV